MFSLVASFGNSSYAINDQKVDAMFGTATEISMPSFTANPCATGMMVAASDQSKVVIGVVVCWLVGGFGIHRHILGTSKPMFLYYTCSVCGIFGIVPLVDFWVLIIDGLINKNGSKYINNDKFIMWL